MKLGELILERELMLTNHAIVRFKQRVDPTATPQQVMKAVLEAEINLDRDFLKRFSLHTLIESKTVRYAHYQNYKFALKANKFHNLIVVTTIHKKASDERNDYTKGTVPTFDPKTFV